MAKIKQCARRTNNARRKRPVKPAKDFRLRILKKMLGLVDDEHYDDRLWLKLRDVVFICIDCKAPKFGQDKVTEIGVAVLDTRDIAEIDLQDNDRVANIKSAYYRTLNAVELRGRRSKEACPNGFNFGATHWINSRDASKVLERIIWNPGRLEDASNFEAEISNQQRNLVFVGHGVRQNAKYFQKRGLSLERIPSVPHFMDTTAFAAGMKEQSVSLPQLLVGLDVEAVNFGNAGNNAAYTLQALVLMAMREQDELGSIIAAMRTRVETLPELVYNGVEAPHIFAGTATEASLNPKLVSEVKQAGVKQASRDASRRAQHSEISGLSRKQKKKARRRFQRALARTSQREEAVDKDAGANWVRELPYR